MNPHSPKELTRRAAGTVDLLNVHGNKMVAVLRAAGLYDYVNAQSAVGGQYALPRDMVAPALTYRTHRRWRESGAVVYNVHPDMVTVACDIDYDRVAARSLDNLPHVNPVLVFPEPVACNNVDGRSSTLAAVYVTGLNHDTRQQCDTDDPQRTGLRLVMVTEERRHDRHTVEHATVHLDTRGDWFDPEELLISAAQRQHQIDPAGFTYDQHLTACRSKLTPALAVLLYVTANDMDHQAAPMRPAQRKRQGRRAANEVQPQVVNVGWREGPPLMAERRAYESRATTGGAAGGRRRAHPRRAHYAHRWADAERTVFTHRWFRKATYIHRPDSGDVPTTIVPVGRTD